MLPIKEAHMKLLKEYIRLILKEELEEDINIQKLSPNMLGVYSFAQAMNKLIYEGEALPGAIPIDIIDAGQNLKSAPMTTKKEVMYGISLQYTGNSFKLYLNPEAENPRMSSGDETHDLVHAFTANLAKAFGRRRQSIEKSGQFGTIPSKFDKITINKKVKDKLNDAFQKEFGFRLPEETFTKPFKLKKEQYEIWFSNKFSTWMNKSEKKSKVHTDILKRLSNDLYDAIRPIRIGPGLIGKKYYAKYPDIERAFDFANYQTRVFPFKVFPGQAEYKQSAEDEEELGNKINDHIAKNITEGRPIPDPKNITDNILRDYSVSVGLTPLNVDEFKHRYDTPEVKNALVRLFQIYNNLLERYKKAKKYRSDKQFSGIFPGVS